MIAFLLDFPRWLPWHGSNNKKRSCRASLLLRRFQDPELFVQFITILIYFCIYIALNGCPEPGCHYLSWLPSIQVCEAVGVLMPCAPI